MVMTETGSGNGRASPGATLAPRHTKFVLDESRIPRAYYNIAADLPVAPPPVIHPGTGQPIGPAAEPEISDVLCDKCGKPTAVKQGRYGKFLGCTGYPACKNIMKYKAPVK